MILEQFNSAVREYCKELGVKDTHERFIATIGGKNILYTKLSEETENWDLAHRVGINLTIDGWVFADVSDIPSQFEHEQWKIPTIIREPTKREISPNRIKEVVNFRGTKDGTVLYNDSFVAYSYAKPNHSSNIGFLSKQSNGEWAGFGESTTQEYMKWLIKTGVIPVN